MAVEPGNCQIFAPNRRPGEFSRDHLPPPDFVARGATEEPIEQGGVAGRCLGRVDQLLEGAVTGEVEIVGVRVIRHGSGHGRIGKRAPIALEPGERALAQNHPRDQSAALSTDPAVPEQRAQETQGSDRGGDSVPIRPGADPPKQRSGTDDRKHETQVGDLVPTRGDRIPLRLGTGKLISEGLLDRVWGATQQSDSSCSQGSSGQSA
jgi:hypothetical protein